MFGHLARLQDCIQSDTPNPSTNIFLLTPSPQVPEKVLDAPEIIDDFYLNILDWSVDNQLAIALNRDVYVWNAITGDITFLMSAGFTDEYVTSLRWSPDVPSVLAVGLSAGRVQLWNAASLSLIRTMRLGDVSEGGRVPVLAWRDHVVTSGSRTGHIRHHDTRIAHHEVGLVDFHTQVCLVCVNRYSVVPLRVPLAIAGLHLALTEWDG